LSLLIAQGSDDFDAAGLMNIFTPLDAISVFPKSTILQSTFFTALSPINETNDAMTSVKNYKDWGFTVAERLDQVCQHPFYGSRYIRDSHCWMVPFKFNGNVHLFSFSSVLIKRQAPFHDMHLQNPTMDAHTSLTSRCFTA